MKVTHVRKVFKKIFSGNNVYRASNVADLKLWKAYNGYKVSESVWKRVPLSLIPSYCFRDPFFYSLDIESKPEFNTNNEFVVEIDVDRLISEGKIVYPCYYYPYHVQEVLKWVNRKYAHVEPVILMFEYEVFTLDDLLIDDIKTVYTEDNDVKAFFEDHGVRVEKTHKLNKDDFKEAFRVSVILRKLYIVSLFHQKKDQKLIKMVDLYNLKLNEWLDKLDIQKVDLSDVVHVPSFKRLVEWFLK